jgi:thiol-disulfide isomerase/thioredoxin
MPALLTILWLPLPFFFLDSGPCKAIAPLYKELSEEFDGGKCLACINQLYWSFLDKRKNNMFGKKIFLGSLT